MASCEKCGTSVSGQTCPTCGTEVAAPQVVTQAITPTLENGLLDEAGIVISTSRIVLGARTFAMSGITSVGTSHREPSRVGPFLLILLSLPFLIRGCIVLNLPAFPPHPEGWPLLSVGVVMLVVAILILVTQKPDYVVTFHSASGQVESIARNDRDFIGRVAAAINHAIILRG